jgi:hypothetical protein
MVVKKRIEQVGERTGGRDKKYNIFLVLLRMGRRERGAREKRSLIRNHGHNLDGISLL